MTHIERHFWVGCNAVQRPYFSGGSSFDLEKGHEKYDCCYGSRLSQILSWFENYTSHIRPQNQLRFILQK